MTAAEAFLDQARSDSTITGVSSVDRPEAGEYNSAMATDIQQIPQTYEEAVELLARWHREEVPSMVAIWAYDDPAREVVRLLEVDELYAPEGEIWSYHFPASETFPYRTEVALVGPEDFAASEAGTVPLPKNYRGAARRLVYSR